MWHRVLGVPLLCRAKQPQFNNWENSSHSKHPSFVVKGSKREAFWFAEVLHICQATERKGNAEDLLSLPSHLPNAPFSFIWKSNYLTCPSPAFKSWSFSPNTQHTFCGQGWLQSKALQIPSSRASPSHHGKHKGVAQKRSLEGPFTLMGAVGCLQHSLNTEKIKILQAEHSKGGELSVSVHTHFKQIQMC